MFSIKEYNTRNEFFSTLCFSECQGAVHYRAPMDNEKLLMAICNSPAKALELLSNGVDPNATDCSETPAVIRAVELGQEDVALALINAGCAVNVVKHYHVRPN